MKLTMNEILDIVPAWTVIAKDTQVMNGPLWIDKVLIQANDGDLIYLYDGAGTTGKVLVLKQNLNDMTQTYELGMLFHSGLYVNISGNTDRMIIVFRPLPK